MAIPSLLNINCMFSATQEENECAALNTSTTQPVDTNQLNKQEMHTESLISDLAMILICGAIITVLFKKLKQPLVLGYIVAGFLVGPNFLLFPSVTNEASIEFWAQIGIIILLFSLGLEFSFKKLMNVGGSAIVTASIIVGGMMLLGYGAGKLLGFSFINSLFLGAMLSMSSTTIIIKALSDLNMKQRRFVPMVFAVLVCEDLFAVIMMVILSSIAIKNSLEGTELLFSLGKLTFFLIIWFIVGILVLPSFFRHFRKSINDEILLVLSMGLCLLMAIFSVYSGFSLALGAFVMGSILAGTCEAEHIERVTKPIKDLFGAVFFISVGMMVNPSIIAEFIGPILLLSAVVIIGMIIFGTAGMLVSGQPLKFAIETGFSLTQIGEFAFIIATMGMSLGVLDPTIYPIVVAVSVITTFFTPYFIKLAEPAYFKLIKVMPQRLRALITRYSQQAVDIEENAKKVLWKQITKRYLWKIILYSTILTAIIAVSEIYAVPYMTTLWGDTGKLLTTTATVICMSPFLLALSIPTTNKKIREQFVSVAGNYSEVPLVVMSMVRIAIAISFPVIFLTGVYSHYIGFIFGFIVFFFVIFFASKRLKKRMRLLENKFVRNLNARELRKSGKDNLIVSDLHIAYMVVGYECPFVGERLANSDLRKNYGVNIVSIQRGSHIIAIPKSNQRIFPGDQIGIIGDDEQIAKILPVIEKGGSSVDYLPEDKIDVQFTHFEITANSPLLNQSTASARLRDNYTVLLIAIQRGENNYIKPTGNEVFQEGDVLWLVGDIKSIDTLKQ